VVHQGTVIQKICRFDVCRGSWKTWLWARVCFPLANDFVSDTSLSPSGKWRTSCSVMPSLTSTILLSLRCWYLACHIHTPTHNVSYIANDLLDGFKRCDMPCLIFSDKEAANRFQNKRPMARRASTFLSKRRTKTECVSFPQKRRTRTS